MIFSETTEILKKYEDNDIIIMSEDEAMEVMPILMKFFEDNSKEYIGMWKDNDTIFVIRRRDAVSKLEMLTYDLSDTDALDDIKSLVSIYGKDTFIEYIKGLDL